LIENVHEHQFPSIGNIRLITNLLLDTDQ